MTFLAIFNLHESACVAFHIIVSQLSKCLKFMTFQEGCFVIHVECKYLSEVLRRLIIISFTKDEMR